MTVFAKNRKATEKVKTFFPSLFTILILQVLFLYYKSKF